MADYKVLFVCMGNICRSPAGEGVLKSFLDDEGLGDQVHVDSAGTIGFHADAPADARMQEAARRRGYDLTSRARKAVSADFDQFDLILAMDKENFRDLELLQSGGKQRAELKLFCDYCQEHQETEVPDPYYGGSQGFEKVLDLIEDGCRQMVAEIKTSLA